MDAAPEPRTATWSLDKWHVPAWTIQRAILVAGGSGLIGAHVASVLRERGHAVTTLARTIRPGIDHALDLGSALTDDLRPLLVGRRRRVGRLPTAAVRTLLRLAGTLQAVGGKESGINPAHFGDLLLARLFIEPTTRRPLEPALRASFTPTASAA